MLDPNRLSVDAFFDYFMDKYHPHDGEKVFLSQSEGDALRTGFLAGYVEGWQKREETYPR